jgi:hypothetical protein
MTDKYMSLEKGLNQKEVNMGAEAVITEATSYLPVSELIKSQLKGLEWAFNNLLDLTEEQEETILKESERLGRWTEVHERVEQKNIEHLQARIKKLEKLSAERLVIVDEFTHFSETEYKLIRDRDSAHLTLPHILLDAHEIQSGHNRVRHAEGLISQLPKNHDGRNSWLLNYGRGLESQEKRRALADSDLAEDRKISVWDERTQSLGIRGGK